MDGNGRWGIKNKNSRNAGHKAGLKNLEDIIKESIKHNIKYLTLFAFSTENWKRPKKEINYLLNLLEHFLIYKIDEFDKLDIKLNIIGKKNFSKKINLLLNNAEKKTLNNTKIQINLALNYGAKLELIHAVKKVLKNKLKINEKNIEKFLYTKNLPEPDFLIRTGKTKRLSNFLLWQLSYSELFFVEKLWPDFNKRDYSKIIKKFKKIKRNFGNI